jgi:NAD(P)-dependent dehydrogenase (short-subunit alcohol dehydrogenase family)
VSAAGTLDGRTAVVTGAASGIGRAMVEQIVAAGAATVVAVDLDAERLAEVASAVGPAVRPVVADVSTADGARRALPEDVAVDILCNNAGTIGRVAAVDETSDEEWARLIGVNLTATFVLTRAAIPGMLARGGGTIINTASVGGLRGGRAGAAYTAAKFGVVGLTQNVAATHGARGIRRKTSPRRTARAASAATRSAPAPSPRPSRRAPRPARWRPACAGATARSHRPPSRLRSPPSPSSWRRTPPRGSMAWRCRSTVAGSRTEAVVFVAGKTSARNIRIMLIFAMCDCLSRVAVKEEES